MRYDPERECSKMVQRLRKICAAKGISVYAAARKANISVSTLNELLNEKTRPQLYTLYKICNALDIRIVDLFDDNASISKQDIRQSYDCRISISTEMETKTGRTVYRNGCTV